MQPLQKPRKIWNIDNTKNKAGLITHYIDLNVQTKNICRDMRFLVMNIGNKDIILGYLWLSKFKPQFDWTYTVINEQALPIVIRCYDPDTFHFLFPHDSLPYMCRSPMTHTDSGLMTHYLQIVPYDITTDVTMTHADSCLLTTYIIMTHTD